MDSWFLVSPRIVWTSLRCISKKHTEQLQVRGHAEISHFISGQLIGCLSQQHTSSSSSRSLLNTVSFLHYDRPFFCAKWNSPGEKNLNAFQELVCATLLLISAQGLLELHLTLRVSADRRMKTGLEFHWSCEFWVSESLRCEWVWSGPYPPTTHNSHELNDPDSPRPPQGPSGEFAQMKPFRWNSSQVQLPSSGTHSLTRSYLKTWIITWLETQYEVSY